MELERLNSMNMNDQNMVMKYTKHFMKSIPFLKSSLSFLTVSTHTPICHPLNSCYYLIELCLHSSG